MSSPLSDYTAPPPNPPGEPPWVVYAEGIRLVALRALGDEALAADVAQEAVSRALAKLAGGAPDTIVDLAAFVYGIARHIIADVHRAGGRTVPLDVVAEPAEPRGDALAAAVAQEDRRRVRAALLQLSRSDRELLYMSFYEGLEPEEIAGRMHESAIRIRKRKSRALERLRRAFFGGRGSALSR